MTASEPLANPEPGPADETRAQARGRAYRRIDVALAAALALIGLSALLGARTIPPATRFTYDPIGPRGFAYGLGVLALILGLGLLLSLVVRYRRDVRAGAEMVEDTAETGDDPRYPASSRRAFSIAGLTFGYALVLVPLGYLLATALHLSACLWVMKARRPGLLVVFPVAYAVMTYLLFDTLLNVRLPSGVLDPLLELMGLE